MEKAERECQAYRAELALHASDKAKLKVGDLLVAAISYT